MSSTAAALVFFFSSRRRHTISLCDWSSDVCSSDVRASPDEYRLLATVLAGMVSRTDGGGAASEKAGRAWGHALVRRPEPHAELEEQQAIAHVVDLLTERGFEPRAEGRRIE